MHFHVLSFCVWQCMKCIHLLPAKLRIYWKGLVPRFRTAVAYNSNHIETRSTIWVMYCISNVAWKVTVKWWGQSRTTHTRTWRGKNNVSKLDTHFARPKWFWRLWFASFEAFAKLPSNSNLKNKINLTNFQSPCTLHRTWMTNTHTSVLNNLRIWKTHAPFRKPFLPLMHRSIELVCLSAPRQMQTYAPIIDYTTRSTLQPSLISNVATSSIQSHWTKTEMSNSSSMKIILNVRYPRRTTAFHWQFAPNVATP